MDNSVDLKKRNEIPIEYTWDLDSMYDSINSWEKDVARVQKQSEEFLRHRGKIGENADNLLKALKDRDAIYKSISNVYSYANMKLDEDTRVGESQALLDKALATYVKIQESTSFLVPEILQIDIDKLKGYYKECKELKLYEQ